MNNFDTIAAKYQPIALSLLRFVTGLLLFPIFDPVRSPRPAQMDADADASERRETGDLSD